MISPIMAPKPYIENIKALISKISKYWYFQYQSIDIENIKALLLNIELF